MRLRRKAFLGSSGFALMITVSTVEYNINVRSRAVAAGWNQLDRLIVSLIVNETGLIGSAHSSMAALMFVGSFPAGSMANLVVKDGGRIVGAGGIGGNGYGYSAATAGEPGGTAIHTLIALHINNNGVIAGGGGGGGGGGAVNLLSNMRIGGSSGGGGAGVDPGSFGYPGRPTAPEGITVITGNYGHVGSSDIYGGGPGGAVKYDDQNPSFNLFGAAGGNGGSWGQSGVNGGVVLSGSPSGSGGQAGAYINGASLTTWANTGTRLGRSIN